VCILSGRMIEPCAVSIRFRECPEAGWRTISGRRGSLLSGFVRAVRELCVPDPEERSGAYWFFFGHEVASFVGIMIASIGRKRKICCPTAVFAIPPNFLLAK